MSEIIAATQNLLDVVKSASKEEVFEAIKILNNSKVMIQKEVDRRFKEILAINDKITEDDVNRENTLTVVNGILEALKSASK